MTPSRWQEIKSLLNEMEQHAPLERQVWLETKCRSDPDLLENVELFLEEETRLDGFLEDSAATLLGVDLNGEPWGEGESGKRIGPYRVMDLLGRGGMGEVYEAVREDDFEQRVALKLIISGRDHPRTLRLFQNERQILARLDHPNIARLLDGGADQQGRPYFAMELIEGEPIDRYCDRQGLTLRGRLELMLQVCDALQMAHQNLVVHRDIKPGNILVDQNGTPKLLDFGIAKLIEPDAALVTQSGSQPMTLLYASPEQLSNEPITPASDLYSLGVLLYRLVTGTLPSDLEHLGYLKLVLAICEHEPTRPSEAIALHSEGELIEVARSRGTGPGGLRSGLIGDVDAILMKALRKEPDQRYASVEKLAQDIRHYLEGRPVSAREGNWAYRTSKFIRRNRWPLAIGTAVLTVILTLSILFVGQAEKTKEERDRAEQVKGFLVHVLISAGPYIAENHEESKIWATVLEAARKELEGYGDILPADRADLWVSMARAYYSLKLFSKAEPLLREALPVLNEVHGERSSEVADALADLGAIRFGLDDLGEAEALCRQSIEIQKEVGQGLPSRAMHNLAAVYRKQGEIARAEEVYREILEFRRTYYEDLADRRKLVGSLRSLAAVLLDQGELKEAESLLREGVEILSKMVRETDFEEDEQAWVNVRVTLGRVVQEAGESQEALKLFEKVAEIRRARLGGMDRNVGLIEKDIASVYIDLEMLNRAEASLDVSREILLLSEREADPELADVDSLMGMIALKEGRLEQARHLLEGGRDRLAAQSPGSRKARLAEQRWQRFLSLGVPST